MIINETDVMKKVLSTETDTQKYQVTTDKKGMPILLYASGTSKWFIHSSYDAVSDGDSFAASNYTDNRDLVVIGLGLGYHLNAFIRMLRPGQKVHVFETNLSLLKVALNNTNVMKCFQNDNIILYAGEGIEAVSKYFFECLDNSSRNSFIFYMPVLNTKTEDYHRIEQYIRFYNLTKNITAKSTNLEDVKKNYNCIPKIRHKKYSIVILDCDKYHSVYKLFSHDLILAFEYLGCNPVFMSTEDFIEAINTTVCLHEHPIIGSCDFFVAFHFSYIISPITYVMRTPIFSIGLDRPYYVSNPASHMNYAAGNVIYTWSDKNDLLYSDIYYKHGAHHFLPQCAQFDSEGDETFNYERFLDVVVLSNIDYYDGYGDRIPDSDVFDKETIGILIKNYIENCRTKTLEEYLQDTFRASIDEEIVLKFIQDMGVHFEDRVRSYKRHTTMKKLLEKGIRVHLFGHGWEMTEIPNHPLCVYHGNVSFDSFLEIFKYSKIFVNIIPSYSMNASHEKVHISMSGGALCITDATEYFRETFMENDEIVFYDNDDYDGLAEKIRYYLSHGDERLRIAKNAFRNVRQNHTWINRAEDIIDMFEMFMNQSLQML